MKHIIILLILLCQVSIGETAVEIPENFQKILKVQNKKAAVFTAIIDSYEEYRHCSGKTKMCGRNPTCGNGQLMKVTSIKFLKAVHNKHNFKFPDNFISMHGIAGGKLNDKFLVLVEKVNGHNKYTYHKIK